MKDLIPPVDVRLIEKELTADKFIRHTNNGNKLIYVITHHDSPNVMREIGRLREISFRDAGGGTGEELDIDELDTAAKPFKQLIVWSPEDKEIIGGYRYILGEEIEITNKGEAKSATAGLFKYSEKFIKEYLPVSIELGRSFIQPNFQASFNIRKGIYSLDNLWDGLGAMVIDNPAVKHLFGKFTMYTHYNTTARDYILYFLKKRCPDNDGLMCPYEPLKMKTSIKKLRETFNGEDFEEDFKILFQKVRQYHENIPPLINAYITLSPTMKIFGTAINPHFGGVEETGMLITIDDIYDIKKERHLTTYIKK
ncbi:GNAT family N-acetyltransferase [Bacteroidota bacterium]